VGDGLGKINILISYKKEKVLQNGVEIEEDVVLVELIYRSVTIKIIQKQ